MWGSDMTQMIQSFEPGDSQPLHPERQTPQPRSSPVNCKPSAPAPKPKLLNPHPEPCAVKFSITRPGLRLAASTIEALHSIHADTIIGTLRGVGGGGIGDYTSLNRPY